MDLHYHTVFKKFIRILRLSGLHPDTKRNVIWMIHFFTKHGLATFVVLVMAYNIIFLNLKDSDYSQTCKNAALSVVYLETTFQHLVYFWKEKHILWLMNRMKEDYKLVNQRPLKEQDIMREYASRAVNVCKIWLMIPSTILSFFPLMNVTLMTYYYIIGEFRLIPLYDLVYPDFIESRKDSLYMYILTYIVLMLYGGSSTVMMATFAPLGPNFMLHACGLLDVVKVRIEVLFKNYTTEEIIKEVKEIAKQLQYIYSYVDRINVCFTVAYEVTFKATTIMLPITCYQVLESLKHRQLSMEFISLIVGGLGLNSTLCFFSDLLLEKGEAMREAVYLCGWEKMYDRQIHSSLMVILLRAQHPVAIRTLFRNVCLITLTDAVDAPLVWLQTNLAFGNDYWRKSYYFLYMVPFVWLMNQSYGLFNLMNAAWN